MTVEHLQVLLDHMQGCETVVLKWQGFVQVQKFQYAGPRRCSGWAGCLCCSNLQGVCSVHGSRKHCSSLHGQGNVSAINAGG